MRVAHRDDYDTHAVIGGKDVQEFAIAQTAEFFTVLSNTLYSNKPLAVIREVLCNAWDAQIVAGTKDKCVIVNIDEDKLSIRDHGLGIPHELIHSIYCVYGNSTKENDGNQTGGFGLGSKSPFAYSDHFTVVNHHAGIKTVHAISRGSALTQGKPDRRVMATVPTTETGVEVMIPVKNREDMRVFIQIAQDIAAFGEMNVMLNDKLVDIVPISTGENNMFLSTRKPRGSYTKINIRYGNVVYPVQPDAEYIGVYNKLMAILDSIPGKSDYNNDGKHDFALILNAPPNSISVTPSRESLSNTETTIKTIKVLFTDLIEHMSTSSQLFEELLFNEQDKAMEYMWKKGYEDRILISKNLLTDDFGPKANKANSYADAFGQITNMVQLADYYLRYNKKISDKMQAELFRRRIQKMIDKGYRRKHDLYHWMKIDADHKNYGFAGKTFKKLVMRPVLKRLVRDEVADPKNLYIVTPNHRGSATRHGWSSFTKYTPDTKAFGAMLQGVVVITHSKVAFEDDWDYRVPEWKDKFPNKMQRMVYLSPRTKGHKEAAIAVFQKLGYFVIDYASVLDAFRATNYVATEPHLKVVGKSKPKNVGLVTLKSNVSGDNFMRSGHTQPEAVRSTEYKYVLKPYRISENYNPRFFPWGDGNAAVDIANLFGSKIGVCINDPQLESQRKKGSGDAIMFLVNEVCQKVLTSADIRTYVENEKGVNNSSTNFGYLMEMAKHSDVLNKAFQLPVRAPEVDLTYYQIFKQMEDNHRYRSQVPADNTWEKVVYDTTEKIALWEPAAAFKNLGDLVKNASGLRYLELYPMLTTLRGLDKINPDYRKKVFIETTVINALSF